ncbi:NAD-dependent epimerase/dehydratase family protein [Kitasatospora sp. NA04385]|uniref:NAD-dependent epimerase/dehydratase family protein n=1 Tax=Kitasatospora sp. NA04385 TaxID=2742135 RepID=UPI0015909D75|nr:NAD(P)-dependent oxidoreductase [Kitasatospora sp. NA04385]QKW21684.1 NAD-dependent epimerase/dehydratase family protein [Kitasatospora sp. NA04385]
MVVLGATGFVGRQVCRAYAEAGARVHGVARGARAGEPEFTPVRLDLAGCTAGHLAGVLRDAGADVVVNAAGGVWGVTEREMVLANAELPALLAAAARLLPGRPRVVHLGSVHEYGPVPPGIAIPEDRPPAPVTPYGRTKLLGTEAVLAAARDHGLDGVVLRVVNVSGPGTPAGSLLGMIAAHLARLVDPGAEPPAPLRLTPLRARRDFVDVRDVADAAVAAGLARPGGGLAGEVFNVGRGEAVPVRGLVDRLIELSGLPVDVLEETDATPQRGAVDWQRVDIGKAARMLGWHPVRDLDTSLRDLLDPVVPVAAR